MLDESFSCIHPPVWQIFETPLIFMHILYRWTKLFLCNFTSTHHAQIDDGLIKRWYVYLDNHYWWLCNQVTDFHVDEWKSGLCVRLTQSDPQSAPTLWCIVVRLWKWYQLNSNTIDTCYVTLSMSLHYW